MPNGTSERSALIEHCGVGGSVRKGTLYPMCAQQRTCVYAVKVRCPPEQGKD